MPEPARTLVTLPKSADLDVHVRLLSIEDRTIVEFVDYVPSLQQHGRGFWLPIEDPGALRGLARALAEAAEE